MQQIHLVASKNWASLILHFVEGMEKQDGSQPESIDEELEIEADEAYRNVVQKTVDTQDEFEDNEFDDAFKSSYANKSTKPDDEKKDRFLVKEPTKPVISEDIPGATKNVTIAGKSGDDENVTGGDSSRM